MDKKNIQPQTPGAITSAGQPLGRGFGDTDKEDLIIPRAKLLQALSPEVQDDKEGKFKQGMIINSLTKEILPVEFMPVFKFTNWIRFNPRKKEDPAFDPAFDAGAIIWRSDNPNDPRVIAEGEFGEDGEKPLATKFMNFFSYFPGMNSPIIVSFSSSSYKTGKQLISLATFAGGDIFSNKYRLTAKQVEKEGFKFYIFEVNPAGKADEAALKLTEGLYESFRPKVKDIKVHDEAAPEEAAAPAAS